MYTPNTFAINYVTYHDKESFKLKDFAKNPKCFAPENSETEKYFLNFYRDELANFTEDDYLNFFIAVYDELEKIYMRYDCIWLIGSSIRDIFSSRYSREYALKIGKDSEFGDNLEFSNLQKKRLIDFILTKKKAKNLPSSTQDKLNSVINELTGVWVGYYQSEDLEKLYDFIGV